MVLKRFFWVIVSGLICFSFIRITGNPSLFSQHEKKVRKVLSRVYSKNEEFVIENITEALYDELVYSNLEAEVYLIKKTGSNSILILGRSNACHEGGCDREANISSGRFEHFDYFVLADELKQLTMIKVLRYDAEYGYEICSKSWLSQFLQDQNSQYIYGENIQALSGATISANAMTTEINKVKQFLQNDALNLKADL